MDIKKLIQQLDVGHVYTWMDGIDITDEQFGVDNVSRESSVFDARMKSVKFVTSGYKTADEDSGVVIAVDQGIVNKSDNQLFEKMIEGKNLIPIAYADGALYNNDILDFRRFFAVKSRSIVLLDTNLNAKDSILDNLYVINYPLTTCVLPDYKEDNHENSKKLVELRNKYDAYLQNFQIYHFNHCEYYMLRTSIKEEPDFYEVSHLASELLKKYAEVAKSHNVQPAEVDSLRSLNDTGKMWAFRYVINGLDELLKKEEITLKEYQKYAGKMKVNMDKMNLGEYLSKADNLFKTLNLKKVRKEKIESIKDPFKTSISSMRKTLKERNEMKQMEKDIDEFSR